MKNTQKLVLLFDGSCNFCIACAELLHVLDWRHRLQCLPFQASGIPQVYGLTVAQCEQAAWAISPDGRIYREAQAVSATLDAIVAFPFFCFCINYLASGKLRTRSMRGWQKTGDFYREFAPIVSVLVSLVACDGLGRGWREKQDSFIFPQRGSGRTKLKSK